MEEWQPSYRRPRQERSQRTFDLLLDSAGELLGEVGIERVSTNQICERAGVTPPAFYRYFDDKYAILEALAERLMVKQNDVLELWANRYRHAGLDVIESSVITLLRQVHEVTQAQPGALWILRALRAIPRLTPIRLMSHDYVAAYLTDLYMPYLSHVPRETVQRRTRISIDIVYSFDEMLKELEIDEQERDTMFDDMEQVIRAMFHYPDYQR